MASSDFNTDFWDDPVIQAASPYGKLLHAFLWTNSKKNPVCIYQITIKNISDATSLTPEQIHEALYEISPSVKYDPEKSIVAVFSHFRHQFMKKPTLSINWVKSAEKCLFKFHGHPFVAEWLSRYMPLLRGCQGVTKGLEGAMEGLEYFFKSLNLKDSDFCTPRGSKGLASPSGKGQGQGPGEGKAGEGGAGGEPSQGDGVQRSKFEVQGQGEEGPSSQEPWGSAKVKIIAHEKSGTAFREFRSALEKHVHDGMDFHCPDDRITRDVVKALGGLDVVKHIMTRDGPDGIEVAFRERYERREQIEFAKKPNPPPVRLG